MTSHFHAILSRSDRTILKKITLVCFFNSFFSNAGRCFSFVLFFLTHGPGSMGDRCFVHDGRPFATKPSSTWPPVTKRWWPKRTSSRRPLHNSIRTPSAATSRRFRPKPSKLFPPASSRWLSFLFSMEEVYPQFAHGQVWTYKPLY